MCGINGLIGFKDGKQLIAGMNTTLSHRGPDAEGIWSEDNIALGHRRLSIIDLTAAANQPMVKSGLVITYNGEIYNFKELKQELISKGVTFSTNSDTEVILELFRVYRENSFAKLLGMFAFSIYDIARQELYLVRDYFGIKPLYYTRIAESRLAFSSELKALVKIPGFKKDLDIKSLVSSVNYLWVYGDDSIFKQVKKVPPAHFMRVSLAKDRLNFETKQYWQLNPEPLEQPEKKLIERLDQIMRSSVQRHLVSDVPVGIFLSGGLDSSLIAAYAREVNPNISAFTINIGRKEQGIEKMPLDFIYAKKVAEKFHLRHTAVNINTDVLNDLEHIVYHLDEPIADPAAINTYLMCREARNQGLKVLLSGMGADEIFCGYRRQQATLLAQRMGKMLSNNWLRKRLSGLHVRKGEKGIKSVRWMKRFMSLTGLAQDEAYMRSYSYYDKNELSELFSHSRDKEINELRLDHSGIFNSVDSLDTVNKMCFTDIHMFMQGLNLAYTDRASMAASVEIRVPFIDREVVEFAMNIPGKMKLKAGTSKYILKKAALARLPKEIVYRPKASFGMPIRAWISRELKGFIDDTLSESSLKKRGIFNPKMVRKIIEDDRTGIDDNAYQIYQFLTLELWLRKFSDQ